MSPDGKAHTQIDHVLIDRCRHASVIDVLSFRAADTDHSLVVEKVKDRLTMDGSDRN
jgi:hypothetical protein